MPQATFNFPAGFLWGTATAAHQVEGNNTTNTWADWENQPGRILNGDKAGRACDWWGGRWKEDFDRAADGGQNAHRMSIEWSRIQPTPDRWNEDALDNYREMVRGLATRNMTPMITLHHFTDPQWLMERGGWENDETPALFAKYVFKVVEALREYCTLWVPINEPNIYTYSGYIEGTFPPGKKDNGAAFHVLANLLRGHAAAYRAIKEIQREARVGTSIHVRQMLPAHAWMPLDKPLAGLLSRNLNTSFLDALAGGRFRFLFKSVRVPEVVGTQDFVGLNYYTSEQVAFAPFEAAGFFSNRYYRKEAQLSEGGFIANEPKGLFDFIKMAQRYNLPVIITENGVEDSQDHLRPRYIAEHVHQIWRALNFNWPVKGYFHWSLVDNFEWERGWTQRFGLWGLDPATQVRTRRPSVDLYAAICKANALSSEMVEKYAPEAFAEMFPG
ncbi:MAG: glycoside hydrolase family 1 protein [Anaerolineaceae bacterium]|nr:glycoside hydrolase family 1 protein [Anaerolineaceae bacterium]